MSLEWVLELDFDFAARKGTVPAVFVADANSDREFVDVGNCSGELFTVGERDGSQDWLRFWIEHVSLKFDRIVFFCDTGKVTRRRMAFAAPASAFEVGLPFFCVSGEKFFKRIVGRHTGRLYGFPGAGVQKGCDVADLLCGHWQCGHALVRAPVTDHFPDQITVNVVGDKRRANEVRAASTGGIRAMAKTAGLLKLPTSAINRGTLLGGKLRRPLRFGVGNKRRKQEGGTKSQEKRCVFHGFRVKV